MHAIDIIIIIMIIIESWMLQEVTLVVVVWFKINF